MAKIKAEINLIKDDYSYWLEFEDSLGRKASINIGRLVHSKTSMVYNCVLQWAMDQFEKNKSEKQ